MNRYRHLFLLVLVALTLASAAIAWAGWSAVAQQQEVDARGAQIARTKFAGEVGHDVLSKLNTIMLNEMTGGEPGTDLYADPDVALIGSVERGKLVLPWDSASLDAKARAFKVSVNARDFAAGREEANRAYARKDYHHESEIYLTMSAASDPNQREFARLLRAGALMRSAQTVEGIELYRSLLGLPSDVVDENGFPLALYKDDYVVKALLSRQSPALDWNVLFRVKREIDSFAALSRSGVFLGPILRELLKSADSGVRVEAGRALVRLAERTVQLERMRALPEARDLQKLFDDQTIVIKPGVWPVFRFASGENWFIGKTDARFGPSQFLIAVRADNIRGRIEKERGQSIQFVNCPSGEPLGDSLPKLCVDPPPLAGLSRMGLPVLFLALALGFVGILLPACLWLLWRDTRHEVHLAALRSQFVSSVSHELKTPLTAIRMFAETLQIRATDGPKRAQYLDIIISESERLTRLLNNVLDFSRIERGEQRYQLQPASLAEVVQSAARTMDFPLTAHGFDFRVEISDEVPPTPIDRDAIEQAVLNLLTNAMKYSGDKRDIALRLRRQNGSALIQVADRGVGIPAEEQRLIFEKFYRVSTPENRAVSGAGLGLALVTHIAEAHGGTVEVESAVGQGSTFSIRLPLQPADVDDERIHGNPF